MNIGIYYQAVNGTWIETGRLLPGRAFFFGDGGITIHAMCCEVESGICRYELSFESRRPTRVKLAGELDGKNPYHLIPCCIYGDNNWHSHRKGDEYPILTYESPEQKFTSPHWEFRADRAALPVSMLFTEAECGAISIEPYGRDEEGQLVRNGVFSELPGRFGVTVGYANLPGSFRNKRDLADPTYQCVMKSQTSGYLFSLPGGAERVKDILAFLYERSRDVPRFEKRVEDAARAVLASFVEQNYSEKFGHYTNQAARLPDSPELKPWRGVYEIAWTGGVILGYPFLQAERLFQLPADFFARAKSGTKLFDEVAASLNPATGMFYELAHPLDGSRINGWWTGILGKDHQNAYTNGQALYYFFKVLNEKKLRGDEIPSGWEAAALRVAETFLRLQREDGCCGYSFQPDRAEVAD